MTSLLNTSVTLQSEQDLKVFRATVKPNDVELVAELVRSTGVFNNSEIEIAKELVDEHLHRGAVASGYRFLLADGSEGLDGYVCFGPIPATDKRFELYWIAVKPSGYRKGLGRKLHCAAEEAARILDAAYLITETSTTAAYAPARAFYRSMGYAHLADIPYWYSDIDGCAVFGKRL